MNRSASLLLVVLLAACGGPAQDPLRLELAGLQHEGDAVLLRVVLVENDRTRDVTAGSNVAIEGAAVQRAGTKLDAVMPGVATVVATYGTLTATTTVTIAPTPLEGIEVVAPDGVTFKVGTSVQLGVMGTHQGGNRRPVLDPARFVVSDERVATVDAGGLLTIHAGGPATVLALTDNLTSDLFPLRATCDYPHGRPDMPADILNMVMPPLSWKTARRPDGSTFHLDLQDLYCDADYQDVSAFLFVLGASWCYQSVRFEQSLADQASDLRSAHVQVIFAEVNTDNESVPDSPDTEWAWQKLSSKSAGHGDGKPAGLVVGDADAEPPSGQACSINPSKLCYFANQKYLNHYPSVFMVRHRDMRIIADQETYYLPLVEIGLDPEASWAEAPLVPSCSQAQTDAHEPDDQPDAVAAAQPVALDTPIEAGICSSGDVDDYSIDVPGDWTATLDVTSGQGGVDLYLWDTAARMVVASVGATGDVGQRVLRYTGPSTIAVKGVAGSGGTYTLTVRAGWR